MTRCPLTRTIALALTLLGAAGCGGAASTEHVAKVAGVDAGAIAKPDVDHWMSVLAKLQQPPGSNGPIRIPNDPPQFAKCVAGMKSDNARLPESLQAAEKPSDSELKEQCRQRYETLKALSLQFLIEARWVQGEAADHGIQVSQADVDRQLEAAKRQQSLRNEADLARYLAKWDLSKSDLVYRARVIAITDKLRSRQVKGVGSVTAADVDAYYAANRQQFAHPELRDILMIEAKSAADANRAKAAVASGQSFAAVARRYSIHTSSRTAGGRLNGMAKGNGDPALDKAVFSARKGVLTGPVHGQVGWFVFKLTKVHPPERPTLTKARPEIRKILIGQQQQKKLNAFVEQLRKKWVGRTKCGKGFVVQDCAGAVMAKPTAPAPSAP